MTAENKNPFLYKWLLLGAAVFLLLIILPAAAYLGFEAKYSKRIYPGVYIGPYEVGGLDLSQARTILTQRVDRLNQEGVKFTYRGEEHVFFPIVSSLESDLVYQNIDFDIEPVIDQASAIGRTGSFKDRLFQKIRALIYRQKIAPNYTLNQEAIKIFLNENFSHFETPAQDAKISYTGNGQTYLEKDFILEEEKYGQILDFKEAVKQLENNLFSYSNSLIELQAVINYPKILKADCLNIENKAVKLIARAPLYLAYGEQQWKLEKKDLTEMMALTLSGSENDKVAVSLDSRRLEDYLKENIAPKIDQSPVEARFEIKEGKVTEFRTSQDGKKLDIGKNITHVKDRLFSSTSSEIALLVSEVKSSITTDTVNGLGVKEIIGTGHSNFAGSPKNRRHNIKTGADALNGLLIKPAEELSLIAALGDIDAASGYLPELVIKGNETIAEYGGGLCQIGTTLFRATLASGLPITQRRNHSYRVSYYEPAGTDATIYDPWPDYRFVNDSPYHILIQSRIEGDDLYFDFWSTEDGRIATTTYPTIYNIVKPAPTKIIETDKLKPGEKKCTESAHAGADAYFDYTVEYPKSNPPEAVKEKLKNQEEIKDEDYTLKTRFKSHYVPWQAVCLVGQDPSQASSSQETKID